MDWQFLIVIAIIGLAAGFIVRPVLRRRKKNGRGSGQCEAGCGCASGHAEGTEYRRRT